MEYQIEKTREERKKSREALIQLYLKSKIWAEFKIAADVEVPEARFNDICACRLHFLKKMHPLAYFAACWSPIMFGAMSFFTALALVDVASKGITDVFGWTSVILIGSWLCASVLHLSMHGRVMDMLETSESWS